MSRPPATVARPRLPGTVGEVCGRTTSTTPRDHLARLLDVDEVETPELPIRWNVAPTQPVYALIGARRGARVLSARRCGLIPHWSADPRIASRLINARGETAADRPAFRQAVRQRRAALVFDGFYEWRRPGPGDKDPAPQPGGARGIARDGHNFADGSRLPDRSPGLKRPKPSRGASSAPVEIQCGLLR